MIVRLPFPGDGLRAPVGTQLDASALGVAGEGPYPPLQRDIIMSIETVILERASEVFPGPGIDAQDADGVEGSSARRRTLILDEEELSRIPGSGERAVPRLGIASGIIRQSSRFAERCSGCDPFAPAWRCIVELEETRAETTQPPGRERTGGCKRQSIMTIRVMARRFLRIFDHPRVLYSSLQKGGDPAAGSPTATLLRLRPSHCARLRRLGLREEFRHRLRALAASMA